MILPLRGPRNALEIPQCTTPHSRGDNSSFWLRYYAKKLNGGDTAREDRYADLLAAAVGEGSKVADIGAGAGIIARKMCARGLCVVGVDLSPAMLASARGHTNDSRTVSLINADALWLPLAPRSVDAVVAVSIVEHLSIGDCRLVLLPEVRRVLRPGGFLFIHVPIKTLKTRLIRFLKRWVLRTLPPSAIDDSADVTHRMWLTFHQYMDLVSQSGLALEAYGFQLRHSRAGRGVSLIADSIQRLMESPGSRRFAGVGQQLCPTQALATSCYALFRKTLEPCAATVVVCPDAPRRRPARSQHYGSLLARTGRGWLHWLTTLERDRG